MEDQSKVGTSWNDAELDAIVEDYFAMLRAQVQGQAFVKAHHARELDKVLRRGRGSIELKHMNISAVLTELGLPVIKGYRPMANYQRAIFPAIDRYLSQYPDAWEFELIKQPLPASGMEESATQPFLSPWKNSEEAGPKEIGSDPVGKWTTSIEPKILKITDCPNKGAAQKPRPSDLERMVRKFDPAGRDHRNRLLGRLGEEMVMAHERAFLVAHDRSDLAQKIEWTSQERGDGAGYDIKSFDPCGNERLIEVKATRGGPKTDFFLTRTEMEVAEERPDAWRLYRLHSLSNDPSLFQLKPPLAEHLALSAEAWRARF